MYEKEVMDFELRLFVRCDNNNNNRVYSIQIYLVSFLVHLSEEADS